MTQRELNCAVARATGESIETICGRGFGLADPDKVSFSPEPSPWDEIDPESVIVDWDGLAASRDVLLP